MNNYEVKKPGHPILAVVLGILGILIALFATLPTGVVGGIIACLLGLAALLIGIVGKKNGGKGIGGIIVGVLAIILAVVMTVSSIAAMKLLKEEVTKYADEAPLVLKSMDNPSLGLLGMFLHLPKDEGTFQELMDQYNFINDRINAEKK